MDGDIAYHLKSATFRPNARIFLYADSKARSRDASSIITPLPLIALLCSRSCTCTRSERGDRRSEAPLAGDAGGDGNDTPGTISGANAGCDGGGGGCGSPTVEVVGTDQPVGRAFAANAIAVTGCSFGDSGMPLLTTSQSALRGPTMVVWFNLLLCDPLRWRTAPSEAVSGRGGVVRGDNERPCRGADAPRGVVLGRFCFCFWRAASRPVEFALRGLLCRPLLGGVLTRKPRDGSIVRVFHGTVGANGAAVGGNASWGLNCA
jgi:hypothetical protein